MKRSKEKMINFDDQCDKLKNELSIQRYSLLPSEQIQAMMRMTTEICRMATARHESVINIQTCKDKTEPDVSSITMMHGHYCVVADNANKRIKVVDTKSKCVTSEVCIAAVNIWSITSVNNEKVCVSVSLPGLANYQIQFFSVSASGVIQTTNQLYDVEDLYEDMVHCKGNIYGINGINMIDILNMTGEIIRTIKTDDKGTDLFGFLEGIALSPDGQTLYVTDRKQHSVTSLTLDGKVKAIYTDKDLKDPRDITVDKHGYVYVVSCGTHNIQQLTADLNKVQVLIDDVYGTEITYSSTENKLYTDDINNIKEYSLDFK
jgi:DNA-binding beta-propeller fold protein YncE